MKLYHKSYTEIVPVYFQIGQDEIPGDEDIQRMQRMAEVGYGIRNLHPCPNSSWYVVRIEVEVQEPTWLGRLKGAKRKEKILKEAK